MWRRFAGVRSANRRVTASARMRSTRRALTAWRGAAYGRRTARLRSAGRALALARAAETATQLAGRAFANLRIQSGRLRRRAILLSRICARQRIRAMGGAFSLWSRSHAHLLGFGQGSSSMAVWVRRAVLQLRAERNKQKVHRMMVRWHRAASQSKQIRHARQLLERRHLERAFTNMKHHATLSKRHASLDANARRHARQTLLRRSLRAWSRGSTLRWRQRVVEEKLVPAIKHHKKMERLAYADAACFALC